jgi:hypothetical protein
MLIVIMFSGEADEDRKKRMRKSIQKPVHLSKGNIGKIEPYKKNYILVALQPYSYLGAQTMWRPGPVGHLEKITNTGNLY